MVVEIKYEELIKSLKSSKLQGIILGTLKNNGYCFYYPTVDLLDMLDKGIDYLHVINIHVVPFAYTIDKKKCEKLIEFIYTKTALTVVRGTLYNVLDLLDMHGYYVQKVNFNKEDNVKIEYLEVLG